MKTGCCLSCYLAAPRGEGSRATSPVAEGDARANRQRVSLVISVNNLHRPEYFNHLSVRASAQMAEAIDTLFRLHLWSECVCLIHSRQGLNKGSINGAVGRASV